MKDKSRNSKLRQRIITSQAEQSVTHARAHAEMIVAKGGVSKLSKSEYAQAKRDMQRALRGLPPKGFQG